jgi:hypothetical protein
MKNTLTVKVSKTVQVQQYEPVTVEVTETMILTPENNNEESRTKLYRRVTREVAAHMENEKAKWEKELKKRKTK